MAQNGEIWQISIPDFQVLAIFRHQEKGAARAKKMTKKLHIIKLKQLTGNNWKNPKNA